jgi:hypothetical protein
MKLPPADEKHAHQLFIDRLVFAGILMIPCILYITSLLVRLLIWIVVAATRFLGSGLEDEPDIELEAAEQSIDDLAYPPAVLQRNTHRELSPLRSPLEYENTLMRLEAEYHIAAVSPLSSSSSSSTISSTKPSYANPNADSCPWVPGTRDE